MRNAPPKRALDRIDCQLVAALQNDARLSNKELAAQVGLAPSSCLSRVRRLRDEGVLQGFRAQVAPEALGIGIQALVKAKLVRHARELYGSLREYLVGLPEVVEVFYLAGADDFLLVVAVRDVQHLRDLVVERLASRSEVSHLETEIVFERTSAGGLPIYVEPTSPAPAPKARRRR